MSEQKILAKNKVPATEAEISEMLDTIEICIYTLNSNELAGLQKKINELPDGCITAGIHRRMKYRMDLALNLYRIFGEPFHEGEFTTSDDLSILEYTRVAYLNCMCSRLSLYNSDKKYLAPYYKYEVDKILEDFNTAVNLIITRYNEFQKQNSNSYKIYEYSHVKQTLDHLTNMVYDYVRLYNRKYEYIMLFPGGITDTETKS